MIKKITFAVLIGIVLCCTTSCHEEHIDYCIEWTISSSGYSGEHFDEYMSEWGNATNAFYAAFDAEFATVGEYTPGRHTCIIRDGVLSNVKEMAKSHAEKAAQNVNISAELSTYPAECRIFTPNEGNIVVWNTVYGK